MFTNNSNEREVLSSLVNCKFEIDLVFVKLNCDGIEISGKGVLYIKEDGQFYLKFFNDHYFGDGERFEHLLSQPRNKTPIYSFVGNDENDKKYSCNYLFSGSPVLNVAEFKLSGKIEMDFPFSYNSKIVFSGEYNLPMDRISYTKTTLSENLWYTDYNHVWEIPLREGITIIFSKFNGYTEAIFVGRNADQINYEFLERAVSTFDFMTGKETEPILMNVGKESHCYYGRKNTLSADSKFMSPLSMSHNRGDEFTKSNHTELFKSYFNFIDTQEGIILPVIHKRIVSSSCSYLFAMGLVLSVQIENLCKEFYYDWYVKDEKYTTEVKEAIQFLEMQYGCKFQAVIERLKSTIPSSNKRSLNVKNILRNLSAKGIIDKDLIDSWIWIRNNTAHGENISGDTWSKFLDKSFSCINLYYILIFRKIGYLGHMRYYTDAHNSKIIELNA